MTTGVMQKNLREGKEREDEIFTIWNKYLSPCVSSKGRGREGDGVTKIPNFYRKVEIKSENYQFPEDGMKIKSTLKVSRNLTDELVVDSTSPNLTPNGLYKAYNDNCFLMFTYYTLNKVILSYYTEPVMLLSWYIILNTPNPKTHLQYNRNKDKISGKINEYGSYCHILPFSEMRKHNLYIAIEELIDDKTPLWVVRTSFVEYEKQMSIINKLCESSKIPVIWENVLNKLSADAKDKLRELQKRQILLDKTSYIK